MADFYLRSGITSLDGMFRPPGSITDDSYNREQHGILLSGTDGISSICIAGPDGTGKSALAMHFASRYTADCYQWALAIALPEKQPLTFYVSSDLSHATAELMWRNFGLGHPNARRIPFHHSQLSDEESPHWLGGEAYATFNLPLTPHQPDKLDDLAACLVGSKQIPQIAFIDLASHTAGDDWGFVERLLATMPVTDAESPRHLLVVDAMEGMETFAGDLDAFGQKVTRRNRIAKLIRLARQKCHVIIVSEEPQENARLPEQFVADVVLRLHMTESHGYSRRTLEIEKARGLSHLRGRHPYVIRDGRGSTTGEQVNYDDPQVRSVARWQSYIDIFPSLHARSRQIMENQGSGRGQPTGRVAGFGIRELDEMLAASTYDPETSKAPKPEPHGSDERGFPSGTVSALIGDANTQKSFLAMTFLGHVFHELAWQVAMEETRGDQLDESFSADKFRKSKDHEHHLSQLCAAEALRLEKRITREDLSDEVCRFAYRIANAGRGVAGAAVLVTTKDESSRTLVGRFYQQLHDEVIQRAKREIARDAWDEIEKLWENPGFEVALTAYLMSRTVCRRLGIHDTPSTVLFHIISRSVEAAQHILDRGFADASMGNRLPPDAPERAKFGWRIRVVIDDLNSVLRTYGKVHEDPMFLPFLLLSLRREGLSVLIVETQSGTHGMPALGTGDDAQSDLRALSDYRLYTWHVPDFFGDHRIAIAAIPPMTKQDRKSPVLVRELEWYPPNSNSPPKVNPEFELYAGLDTGKPTLVPLQVHLYAETPAWQTYILHLDNLWRHVFAPPHGLDAEDPSRPVVTAEKSESYELLQEVCDLHANTSLDYSLILQVDEFWQHRDTFRSQTEYLNRVVDPSSDGDDGEPIKRRSWFSSLPEKGDVDRVPFVWDFGFLAVRERLWNEATSAGPRPTVEESWLTEKRREIQLIWQKLKKGEERCTWPEVLEAASYVAKWESVRQSRPVPAFDLAMVAPETFSCLVLEVWFSEIYESMQAEEAQVFSNKLRNRQWDERADRVDLIELVEKYWKELYRSWLIIVEVLDLDAFTGRPEGYGFGFGRKADANAVVVRHWYKSASDLASDENEAGPVRFCRLPGTFTVRGDWFLATVRGSRSDRLADRAIDLLSTVAANGDRLTRGLGLPTHLKVDGNTLSTRLWGWRATKSDPGTLTYADVLSLGQDGIAFHWLWRSNLKHYYAIAPIWERWLYRILRRWKRTKEFVGTRWVSGFDLYTDLKKEETPDIVKDLVSWPDFQTMCQLLKSELERVET